MKTKLLGLLILGLCGALQAAPPPLPTVASDEGEKKDPKKGGHRPVSSTIASEDGGKKDEKKGGHKPIPPSDAMIEGKVRTRLTALNNARIQGVMVSVDKGVVTLSGKSLLSPSETKAFIGSVSKITGVTRIVDKTSRVTAATTQPIRTP